MDELLLGLRYFRNEWNAPRLSVKVNYYLNYGTSETRKSTEARSCLVNYYLDYGTSETFCREWLQGLRVNYYLDYRTSETEQ